MNFVDYLYGGGEVYYMFGGYLEMLWGKLMLGYWMCKKGKCFDVLIVWGCWCGKKKR